MWTTRSLRVAVLLALITLTVIAIAVKRGSVDRALTSAAIYQLKQLGAADGSLVGLSVTKSGVSLTQLTSTLPRGEAIYKIELHDCYGAFLVSSSLPLSLSSLSVPQLAIGELNITVEHPSAAGASLQSDKPTDKPNAEPEQLNKLLNNPWLRSVRIERLTVIDRRQGEEGIQLSAREIEAKLADGKIVVKLNHAHLKRFSIANNIQGRLSAVLDPIKRSATLKIKTASAELLGGQVTAPSNSSWSIGAPENRVTLNFSDIDLEQLLKLHPQRQVAGTGVIDGTIPMTVDAKGLSITGGTLHSRPPGGVLRYLGKPPTADQLGEGGQTVGVVAQALSNYHYTRMELELNYTPDGNAVIQATLQGSNPDFQSGRAINLNLKLEENLLELYRSLQIGTGKGIERSITNQTR